MNDGYEPVKPEIECVDVWHPKTYTPEAMATYQEAERQEYIVIQGVEVGKALGEVVVRYLSAIPHEWTLEVLSQVKRELKGEMDGRGRSDNHA